MGGDCERCQWVGIVQNDIQLLQICGTTLQLGLFLSVVSAKDGLSVISRPPSCGEALGSEEEDSDSVVVVSF